MKYAQIKDGKIVNIIDVPADASAELLQKIATGFDALKPADEVTSIGDNHDAETDEFTKPEPDAETDAEPDSGQAMLENGSVMIPFTKSHKEMVVALSPMDNATEAGFALNITEGESFSIISSDPSDARTVNWAII